jgi:hypothetical protein
VNLLGFDDGPELGELSALLFCSHLQPSDHPTPEQIRSAIDQTAWARPCCAGLLAQEIGDHPETAYARLRWCRQAVLSAYRPADQAASCSAQEAEAAPWVLVLLTPRRHVDSAAVASEAFR